MAGASLLGAEQAVASAFGVGTGEIAISFPTGINVTNNAIDFINSDASPDPNWNNTGDLVGGAHTGTVTDGSAEYLLFGDISVENAGTTGIFAGGGGSLIDLRNKEGIIRDIAVFGTDPLVSGQSYSAGSDGLNWIKYDLNDDGIFGNNGDLTYSFTSFTPETRVSTGGGFRTNYDFEGYFTYVSTGETLASTFSLFNTVNASQINILTQLDPAANAAEFNGRVVNNFDTASDELLRLTFDGKQGAEAAPPPTPEPATLLGALVAFGSGLLLKKQAKLS